MTEKKKDEEAPKPKKAEEKAPKEKNTTDTNAGPDADFGDGEYHNVPSPERPEFTDVNK
jgi:hypothetical protein